MAQTSVMVSTLKPFVRRIPELHFQHLLQRNIIANLRSSQQCATALFQEQRHGCHRSFSICTDHRFTICNLDGGRSRCSARNSDPNRVLADPRLSQPPFTASVGRYRVGWREYRHSCLGNGKAQHAVTLPAIQIFSLRLAAYSCRLFFCLRRRVRAGE